MTQEGADRPRDGLLSWRVLRHTRDRSPHGGPPDGSAYPLARCIGRVVSRLLPPQVFQTFQILIAGWIVCLGPHTISEVWQATGWAAKRHHDTAYAVFHSAAWEWDDLGIVLATLILAHLVPGGVVWIVVDDTLCHKRGAKVAFGGIFLDAVLSSKRHKTLRFGLNWVVLGIAVPIPLRTDRYYCLPVLWRLYRKKGQAGYQTRPQAAAALARQLAEANPESDVLAGRRFGLRQRGVVARPAGEPPGDRPVALEGGPVRTARTAATGPAAGRRARRGIACRTPRR